MPRIVALLLVTLLLAGCGRELEGTYTDNVEFMSFTFHPEGRVVQATLGVEVEMIYEDDGETILIKGPAADMELRRIDERTLEGPFGMRLTRREP